MVNSRCLRKSWALLLAVAAICGCSSSEWRAEPIGAILKEPAHYLGKDLTVKGRVTSHVQVPLLPAVYWLDDGTGVMPVLAQQELPGLGSTVTVSGHFSRAVALGSSSFGLHLKEVTRR